MNFPGAPETRRVEALLGRYLELRLVDGASADPEELCRDSPELLEPLRELIRDYENVDEMLAAPGELPAGRILLHYRILCKIGAGGMGQVYVAEDTKLGRRVAVKVLPPGMRQKRERLERFRREARVVAALNHPNIVTLFSVEEAGDLPFITMELVEGKTLSEIIPKEGLPPEDVLKIALPLTAAVSAAHEKGITHRDLKPANIMVSDTGLLKVLDFGLAKLPPLDMAPKGDDVATRTLDDQDISHLTRTGLLLGTVPYMSPEQVRGQNLGPRSDVFSLGIVLYETSTGRRPFQGASVAETIQAILTEAPTSAGELRPSLPREIVHVIERCLAKDPKERYPTARELHGSLAALREQMDSGDTTFPLTVLPARRHTVGREKELAELHEGLAAVADGRGLLLCVAGEPGIGKTTLVEDFLTELASKGPPCTTARGRCSERLAGTEAYLPFLDVLESLLKGRADDSVLDSMQRTAPWWYVQLASLSPDNPVDARLTGEVRNTTQERIKRELAAFLQELSQQRPVVFFFDDLHWSDVSTIDLLAYLAARFDDLRLLILATYRPEELALAGHPFLQIRPDLKARGLCREIDVTFLSLHEIQDYLALECPEHDFPAAFAKLIHDKTEGNPLFMADLVRYLRDRETIIEEDGGWALSQTVSDIQLGIPDSAHSLIQRKIDHLSDDDRRLLVAASVQGYEFDTEVVSQVRKIDIEVVEERLQTLERDHRFVQFLEEEEFPDLTLTLRYRFVHVLYQNELYASLTRTQQARLSRSVAQALLGHYGEECGSVAAELAALFETARDFAQATAFLGLAAQNALQVFAYQETILLANRGLRLLEVLPDTPEMAQRELELQIALGLALMSTKGYASPEVEESNRRKRELILGLGETPQLFPARWSVYTFYFLKGDLRASLAEGRQLVDIARQAEDSTLRLLSQHAMGLSQFYRGEFVAAREHLAEALNLYDPEEHGPLAFLYGSGDIKVNALMHYSLVLWFLGYPDQARGRMREAVLLSEKLSQPYSLSHALLYSTVLYQYLRDPQTTRRYAEEGIHLNTEHGFLLWLAGERILFGWTLADAGERDEGITQLRQGLDAWQATGAHLVLSYSYSLLADVHGKAGRPQEALLALTEALTWVETNDERFWEAEVYRLQGELLLTEQPSLGETEAGIPQRGASPAEELFHRSLEVARRRRAKSLELRSAMSLSRLWRTQGRRAEAREMLQEVYGWFTEGRDTADLREAAVLLEELS